MNLPQIKQYEFERFLGEGATGYVYACRSGEASVSLKLFKGLAIDRGFLEGAIARTHGAGTHPHIAPVLDWDLKGKPAFVVTDLRLRGEGEGVESAAADRVMAGWEPERVWPLLGQMAGALAWLHECGVSHCSFAPGNVFVDEAKHHVWVTDYAQGWIPGIYHMETAAHWRFSAPEQLRNPASLENSPAFRGDVYAFGATAVYLLTGRHVRGHGALEALRASGDRDLSPAVLADTVVGEPFEWSLEGKADARNAVLRKCVCEDPAERYADMGEVAAALQRIASDAVSGKRKRKARAAEPAAAAPPSAAAGRRGWVSGAALGVAAAAVAMSGVQWLRHESERKELVASIAKHEREAEESRRNAAAEAESAVVARGEAEERAELLGENLEEVLRSSETLLSALLQSDPASPEQRPYHETLAAVEDAFRSMVERTAGRPDLVWARVRAVAGLATILKHTGREEQAVELYDEARRMLEMLPAGRAASRSQRLLEVEIFSELGEMLRSCGNAEGALPLLRRAVDLAAELGRGEGAFTALQRATALAQSRLAVLGAGMGKTAEAIEEGQTAVQLLETILDAGGGSVSDRFLLAQSQARVARWLDWRGDFEQALEGLQEAAAHFETLVASSPSQRTYRFLLAECRLDRGRMIIVRTGEHEAAASDLETAAEFLRSLVDVEPASKLYRLGLVQALAQLAQAERDYGSHERAAAYAGEARILLEDLDPEGIQLAVCTESVLVHTLLGLIFLDGEDPVRAAEEAEAARRCLERLQEHGTPPEGDGVARARLADLCGDLSQMFLAMNREEDARAVLSEAVSTWRDLADRFEDDERIRTGLEWSESLLARLP